MGKSLYKNSIYFIAYRVINVVYPLITATYVARILGPEGVGRVSIAQTVVIFLTACASLGIPNYGTREVSKLKDKSKLNKLFTELFILNAVSTIIISILYYIIVHNIPYFRGKTLLYDIEGLILILNIINVDWFFHGVEEFKYITIRSCIVKIISVVCIFIFVKNKGDIYIYALIFALAYAGNYLFNIWHLRNFIRFKFRRIRPIKHLKSVFILAITYISNEIYVTIDTVMIGVIVGDITTGYYSNAMKLIKILINVCAAIGVTLLPRLSRVKNDGDDNRFNSILTQTIKILIWFTAACVVGIWLTADKLIPILFGIEFYPSITIIKILCFLVIFRTFSNLFLQVCLCVNEDKKTTKIYFWGMILNIFLNLILIPKYEANGAAVASVISELYMLITLWLIAYKYMKIKITSRYYISVLLPLLVMILAIMALNMFNVNIFIALVMDIIFGVFSYIGVSLLLKNDIVVALKKRIMLKSIKILR